MFEQALKQQIRELLTAISENGLKWKLGKDKKHLTTRKEDGHIPDHFTIDDYNDLIIEMLGNIENDIYIYFIPEQFTQNYFAFTDYKWNVIIGENGIMETAIFLDKFDNYFEERPGFTLLGKIEEVFE